MVYLILVEIILVYGIVGCIPYSENYKDLMSVKLYKTCFLILVLTVFITGGRGLAADKLVCAALSKQPYSLKSRDTGPGGFCSEVLERAAQKAGIMVIMQDGSYERLLGELAKGDIDCVPFLSGSRLYQEKYSLSALNLVLVAGYLLSLNDGRVFNYTALEGVDIGFVRSDLAAQSYYEQLQKLGITFNTVWFDTYIDVQCSIINGELEYAAVSEYIFSEVDESVLLTYPLDPVRITPGFRSGYSDNLKKSIIRAILDFQENYSAEYYRIVARHSADRGCVYSSTPVDTLKYRNIILVLGGLVLFFLVLVLYKGIMRYRSFGISCLFNDTDKYYKSFMNLGVPVLMHKIAPDGKNYILFSNPAADRFFPEGYSDFNFDKIFYSGERGDSINGIIKTIPPGGKKIYNVWKKDSKDKSRYEAITNVMPSGEDAMTVIDCRQEQDNLLVNLQDSQYALEMATEVGKIGVFEFDLKTMILQGSNQCFVNLGIDYLENGISFKDVLKMVEFENYRGTLEDWRDLVLGRKKEFTAEVRVRSSSGEKHWMRINAKDRNWGTKSAGKRFVGVIIDIDDVKALNSQLEEFSRNFELLMDISQDDIYAKDNNYRFLWCSRSFALKHGFADKSDIVGKDDFVIHSNYLATEFRRVEQKVLTSGTPIINCEQYHYNIAGEKKWVLCTKVPIRDSNGIIQGLIGINKDITDYKNVLKTLNESQRIQSVGKLAGGIAHEFNNALNGIMGFASILEKSHHIDSAERKFVAYILEGTDRCERLTRHLLAFAGKGKYVESVIDIHKLIRDTVEIMKHSLRKSIELEFDFAAEKSRLMADSSQIENVIINLVANAEYAIADSGVISIQTHNVPLPPELKQGDPSAPATPSAIEIKVIDNGIGIAQENIWRVFEPFFYHKKCGRGRRSGFVRCVRNYC